LTLTRWFNKDSHHYQTGQPHPFAKMFCQIKPELRHITDPHKEKFNRATSIFG